MLRESCTERGDSIVQEAGEEMDMVVEKLRTELLFARFTLWRTELLFK